MIWRKYDTIESQVTRHLSTFYIMQNNILQNPPFCFSFEPLSVIHFFVFYLKSNYCLLATVNHNKEGECEKGETLADKI